jgi:2-polyprenyl-3-methyl-5-hydroxy-6-metoxy-1,4-benzoquinol methylase
MKCLFCNSSKIELADLPKNRFSNILFCYFECSACKLLFIDPIPSQEVLIEMYPPSYQGSIETEQINLNNKMPGLRFTYLEQFDLIKKYCGISKQVLDYGCGTGHFIYNLRSSGHEISGVEFSVDTVNRLAEAMPENKFYTVIDFLRSDEKYSLIRLSNVLEHFTNPEADFKNIIDKIEVGGYVMLEGPLEKNSSLVNYFKWSYFKIRYLLNKNYVTSYAPTHILFTNYKNQLAFFEKFNLITLEYKVRENAWPYPEKLNQINSPGTLIKYTIGILSKLFALFIPRYGNTFLYVGRKE